MARTLGVGIIGCGNISTTYLKLGPLFKGFEIRAVADLNMAAAQSRAAQFGVAARTVTDLLASTDIDIVVNLTVPAAHFDVSKQILEAGKHVYSEKPLTLTLAEGKALLKLATARKLHVAARPIRSSAAPTSRPAPPSTMARSAGSPAARPISSGPAWSTGIRIPISSSSPAADPSSTWAPTTSWRSSISSGR